MKCAAVGDPSPRSVGDEEELAQCCLDPVPGKRVTESFSSGRSPSLSGTPEEADRSLRTAQSPSGPPVDPKLASHLVTSPPSSSSTPHAAKAKLAATYSSPPAPVPHHHTSTTPPPHPPREGHSPGARGVPVKRRAASASPVLPHAPALEAASSPLSSPSSGTESGVESPDFVPASAPPPHAAASRLRLDDEEEEICCICLEVYTNDNPRFEGKCHHHFHLPCLLSWKQRSNTCPMCCAETLRGVGEFEDAGPQPSSAPTNQPDLDRDAAYAQYLQEKYARRERRARKRAKDARRVLELQRMQQLQQQQEQFPFGGTSMPTQLVFTLTGQQQQQPAQGSRGSPTVVLASSSSPSPPPLPSVPLTAGQTRSTPAAMAVPRPSPSPLHAQQQSRRPVFTIPPEGQAPATTTPPETPSRGKGSHSRSSHKKSGGHKGDCVVM